MTLNVSVVCEVDQLRQNGQVPRYAETPQPSDPRAVAAMSAFGINQVRSAILRFLAAAGHGVTSGQITRYLGANYQTVFRHLRDLEASGIVSADAGTQRQGQRVEYHLNREALDNALAEYADYLKFDR